MAQTRIVASSPDPEGGPGFPPTGTLEDAIQKTALIYRYFTTREIARVKPSYVNEGDLSLRGIVHKLAWHPDQGIYVATAALGNVATHDNLRYVANSTNEFGGYRPPETFAYDWGAIYTRYYPRIDRTEKNVVFDRRRPGATVLQYHEASVVSEAVAQRLEFLTGTIGSAIKVGIYDPAKPVSDRVFAEDFVPRVPDTRDLKTVTKGDNR